MTDNNIQFVGFHRSLNNNGNNANLNSADIEMIVTPKEHNDENSVPDKFGRDNYTRFVYLQWLLAKNSGVINLNNYKIISFISDDKKNDKITKKYALQKIAVKKFNITWNLLKPVPMEVYDNTNYSVCGIINNYILIPEILKFTVQMLGYFTIQKPFNEQDTTKVVSSKSPKFIFLANKDNINNETKIFLNNIGLHLISEFNKHITSTTVSDFNKNKLRIGS